MTESSFPQERPLRTGPTRRQQITTIAGTTLTGAQVGGPIGAGFGLLAGIAINFLAHKETDPKLENRPDPRVAVWENNPYAFHTIGQEAAVGGKVLFALHKLADKPTDDSKRLDLVIGMNPGPLEEPTGQLFVLLNGHRYRFTRETAIAADDEFGIKPNPRHHWEPEAGSIIEGCARAYCNFEADGTQGIELQNWAAKRPKGLDSSVQWVNPWDSTCLLNGIAWIHLILNFTEQGIRGNVHNRKEFTQRGTTGFRYRTPKARVQTGITSMPTVSFQIPKGKALTSTYDPTFTTQPETAAFNAAKDKNSARFALWVLKNMVELDDAFIDTDTAKAAVERCHVSYTGKRRAVDSEGHHFPITIRPFDVAGGFDDNFDPLRILQALETIWNGHIAYQDGKIALLPGDYARSAPQATHVLNDDNIIEDVIVDNTVASGTRYNTVSLGVKACRQSTHNAEVYVRDQQKGGARIVDNVAIVEELQPLAFVNDYYQAQHIARARAAMHAVRLNARRITTFYTPDISAWRVGDPLNLTVADAGIRVPRDMVIQRVSKGPNFSIFAEASERPIDDPWAIDDSDPVFDDFTEVEPPLIDQDFLIPPENMTAVRVFGLDRVPQTPAIDEVIVRADYPGRGIVAEVEVQVDGADPPHRIVRVPALRSVDDAGDSILEITFEVAALVGVDVRMRYTSEGEDSSDWSDTIFLDGDVITIPNISGLEAASIQPMSALATWYPTDYVGQGAIQLRYGSGDKVGNKRIGSTINLSGEALSYPLEGLTPEENYWVQVRYQDENGRAGSSWNNASNVKFTTPAIETATSFVLRPQSFNFKEEEVVADGSVLLPALNVPDGVTLNYSLEGTLPDGLVFTASDRGFSGTLAEGSHKLEAYILTYKATNAADENDFAVAPVFIQVAEDDQPITFTQGDTYIVAVEGTRELSPASPQLPAATGGNGTLVFSIVRGLPNFLEFDDSTRRLAMDDDDTVVVPSTHPSYTIWYRASDGVDHADIPITVVVRPKIEDEEQVAYQWHSDYATPPTITQTERDRINDAFRPTGWLDAKGSTPTDGSKPYLWRMIRTRPSTSASWTLWHGAQVIDGIGLEQDIAYQWHSSPTTAPAITQTQHDRLNNSFVPTGWSKAEGTAPSDGSKPHLWIISRQRIAGSRWTEWGNAHVDPDTLIPVEQLAYQYHSSKDSAPAVVNTQSEQTDNDEVPNGWSDSKPPTTTSAKPYLWIISRRKIGVVWSLWGHPVLDPGKLVDQLKPEEQSAYQWHNDYIAAPPVVNTQSEQNDNDEVPAGWKTLATVGDAPDDKPYLWRVSRSRVGNGPWQLWSDPEIVPGDTIKEVIGDIDIDEQVSYQWHNSYADAPAIVQTERDRLNDSFRPDNWTATDGGRPADGSKPYLWRIERVRASTGNYSLWRNPTLLTEPDIDWQQAHQWHDSYTVPPTITQTERDRLNDAFIPTGWTAPQGSAPSDGTKPYLWRIEREKVQGGVFTQYRNAHVIKGLGVEKQVAYRWHDSAIAPPAITQTQRDRINSTFRPVNWTAAEGSAPADGTKPHLWRIERDRVEGSRYTLWGNATLRTEPDIVNQIAYQWHSSASSPPAISQTERDRLNDSFRPTGWTVAKDMTPEDGTKPHLWSIERSRVEGARYTLWGNATLRTEPDLVRQVAYQWHDSYTTAPAIAQTERDRLNDSFRPAGWAAAEGSAPADGTKPYLWRIEREKVVGGVYATWGSAEMIRGLSVEKQRAYQWHDSRAAAPTITQTERDRLNNSFRPTGWAAARGTAPDGKPYLWSIERDHVEGSRYTLWGNAAVDPETLVAELDIEHQVAYQWGASASSPPAIVQTERDRLVDTFRPANWTAAEGTAPSSGAAPYLWRIERDRIKGAAYSLYRNAEVIRTISLPVPRFAEAQFLIFQAVVNQALNIQLPAALYSGSENLVYSLSPAVPSNAGFNASARTITGAVTTVGVSSHQYRATVANSDRSVSLAIVLNIIPPDPEFTEDSIDDL